MAGKIIQKIFTPLATPDYGSYVAQVKGADAIFLGTAGSNGFRFLRQFIEYGLKDKMAVIGGMTALDESVLRNMGDEALGILTTSWYSAELDNPLNKVFAPAFRKEFEYDPGFYVPRRRAASVPSAMPSGTAQTRQASINSTVGQKVSAISSTTGRLEIIERPRSSCSTRPR